MRWLLEKNCVIEFFSVTKKEKHWGKNVSFRPLKIRKNLSLGTSKLSILLKLNELFNIVLLERLEWFVKLWIDFSINCLIFLKKFNTMLQIRKFIYPRQICSGITYIRFSRLLSNKASSLLHQAFLTFSSPGIWLYKSHIKLEYERNRFCMNRMYLLNKKLIRNWTYLWVFFAQNYVNDCQITNHN